MRSGSAITRAQECSGAISTVWKTSSGRAFEAGPRRYAGNCDRRDDRGIYPAGCCPLRNAATIRCSNRRSPTRHSDRTTQLTRLKLPIGVQTFREIREDGCYYVNKTAFILCLIEQGKYYFLSRPRRFGKSLLPDTLAELFAGNQALFRGLYAHDRHAVLFAGPADRARDLPRLRQLETDAALLSAFEVGNISTKALRFQTGYLTPECRVCARDTRRVDPSPPGLAQGDNLLCPAADITSPQLTVRGCPKHAL